MYTGGFYAGSGEKFYIQDDTGGMQVYSPDPSMPDVTLGDWVVVTGTLGSYRNERQVQPAAVPDDVDVTDGSPGDVPAPRSVALDEIGEETEGWLVQIRGRAARIEEFTYSWEMDITDGRTTVLVYVDKNTGIDLTGYPVGYTYLITGISAQYNDTYEVKPRLQSDIQVLPSLIVEKEAPMFVGPGDLLTYTITVSNYTQLSLTDVVVTDRVPITNADLARILDGGTLMGGGIISWTAASLADGTAAAFRFVVTATDEVGAVISNTAYAAWATNWPTHEVGAPVYTIVSDRDYIPIYRIQGNGFRSPYDGVRVRTTGVVVGFFEGNYPGSGRFDGFFIQDPTGDGITTTSDGLFVNYGSLPISVNPGDWVVVTGTVEEFSEWDGTACGGDECVTQIGVDLPSDVAVVETGIVTPTVLDPPGDPDEAAVYWESLEGMWVTLPMTGVVVGPTSYGTVMVVPGDEGITRVLRGSPYEGMPVGVRHYRLYGDLDDGSDPPNLIVGSVVTNVDGPLMFSYGNYLVATQAGDAWQAVYTQPLPSQVPSWPAAGANEFTIATFNTYNFDGEDVAVGRLDKVTATIEALGYPTFLALEEIATLSTCTSIDGRIVTGVITDLIDALQAQGYTYAYAASHPDVGCHGVALLWRTDRVTDVVWSTDYQGCSAHGSTTATAYDHYCDGTGLYPLFSRRPVVLTATVTADQGPLRVVVVANHFKSKRGGAEADQRRLEQAQFVAGLVSDFAKKVPHVLVLGDLNDFETSPPLEALYANAPLTSTWFALPETARYSYIYRGVSQVLDHILTSERMRGYLKDVSPLHLNADFPYKPYFEDASVVWRTSDHDPVVATFRWYRVYLPQIMRAGP